MKTIPENVKQAWENREGPVILTTINKNKVPNSIYATCVSIYQGNRIIIADNYFQKTRQNIQEKKKAAVLFMDKNGKAYQIKGTIESHQDGEFFENMKQWNPPEHPGHAAAVLTVEEIYSGADQII